MERAVVRANRGEIKTSRAVYIHEYTKIDRIEFTGKDVANLFKQLDSFEQAAFLNSVGKEKWIAMQLQYITDEPSLNFDGRYFMSLMGDYSENQRSNEGDH